MQRFIVIVGLIAAALWVGHHFGLIPGFGVDDGRKAMHDASESNLGDKGHYYDKGLAAP